MVAGWLVLARRQAGWLAGWLAVVVVVVVVVVIVVVVGCWLAGPG